MSLAFTPATKTALKARDLDRRQAHVRNWIRVDERGCWIWQGRLSSQGYGMCSGQTAQRYSYRAFRGEFQPELEIDHLCRNPPCVNPDHLEPVTRDENARRKSAAKTHCKRGHELTPNNVLRGPAGNKPCRRCSYQRAAAYRERRRTARRGIEVPA